MARYIDAEKLCKSLRDMAFYQNPYKQSTILGVVSSIENFSTADVVPKSEVENLLKENERWMLEYEGFRAASKQIIEELKAALAEAKVEVAREIFEEIESICLKHVDRYDRYIMCCEELAELKKKYIGGKTDEDISD